MSVTILSEKFFGQDCHGQINLNILRTNFLNEFRPGSYQNAPECTCCLGKHETKFSGNIESDPWALLLTKSGFKPVKRIRKSIPG
jgi:hypothetical protein